MVIKGKYVKIRFKIRVSPCCFLSSRGQMIKNITKVEQETALLYILGFICYGVSHAKTDLHNKWFNFVFGLFFQQDHLLNLFISRVYAKRWPKCARTYFSTKIDVAQNLMDDFCITLTDRGPFHRKNSQ